jgi:hypothetical protein
MYDRNLTMYLDSRYVVCFKFLVHFQCQWRRDGHQIRLCASHIASKKQKSSNQLQKSRSSKARMHDIDSKNHFASFRLLNKACRVVTIFQSRQATALLSSLVSFESSSVLWKMTSPVADYICVFIFPLEQFPILQFISGTSIRAVRGLDYKSLTICGYF